MDWLEEQNLVRKLMRLYHQRGYEMTVDEVKRAGRTVYIRYGCTLEEAYLWLEDNMSSLMPLEDIADD